LSCAAASAALSVPLQVRAKFSLIERKTQHLLCKAVHICHQMMVFEMILGNKVKKLKKLAVLFCKIIRLEVLFENPIAS
jgi:hypothetical protein